MSETALPGTVVAIQANYYQVRLEPLSAQENWPYGSVPPAFLLCTRRARLKKVGQKVMVGDRVLVEEPNLDGRGAIAHVFPRKTVLMRPPVANADQILLVFALEEPALDAWQLSRFLVKAESVALELCLCLNKADLVSPERQRQWQQRLNEWGYTPAFISVANGQGLEALGERLKQQITILAGPSGVGKSSLIKALIPTGAAVRVGQVSGKLGRGRHTTRHVELFELHGCGLLADSPGFNQPDLECAPSALADYFPEIRQRLAQGHCQFSNCLHRDEPNCVVRGDWERYEHYLKYLEEAIARSQELHSRPDEEPSLKLKVKESGQHQYEPKLATKKYRRLSRRQRHQSLQEYENQSLEELTEGREDL
ncbi:MAG: small ribosomal subunit biogenesis GTPase RsgA [Cyanophyceae cyanobacterium]